MPATAAGKLPSPRISRCTSSGPSMETWTPFTPRSATFRAVSGVTRVPLERIKISKPVVSAIFSKMIKKFDL